MLYNGIIRDKVNDTLYTVSGPGIGLRNCPYMERADSLIFKVGDEVYIEEVCTNTYNRNWVIVGKVPVASTNAIVAVIDDKKSKVDSLADFDRKSLEGDLFISPDKNKKAFMWISDSEIALLQANNSTYLLMADGTSTWRTNHLALINPYLKISTHVVGMTTGYVYKVVSGSISENAISTTEEQEGNIALARSLYTERVRTDGWTKRIGDWCVIEFDNTAREGNIDVLDSYTEESGYVQSINRNIKFSKTEISATFGVEKTASGFKLTAEGAELFSGTASIKLTTDGTIEINGVAVNLKSSQSFVSVNSTGVAINGSVGTAITKIEVKDTLTYNKMGQSVIAPNVMYSIAGGIDVSSKLTVKKLGLVNENFFNTKWLPLLISLDSHMHTLVPLSASTNPLGPVLASSLGSDFQLVQSSL